MIQTEELVRKMEKMLLDMGFQEVILTNPYRSEKNYVLGNLYCIPQYVAGLGFLIEYATSYHEAVTHGHEDGDAFPVSFDEEEILKELEKEVRQNIEWYSA